MIFFQFKGMIVKRLASEGAAVAFTYASSSLKAQKLAKEIEANGGKALALRADSQDVSAVKNAVAEAIATLGNINILVNNAGLFNAKPYYRTTSEIAGLVAYLASSEAAYITGASIDINGGFMI